MSLKVGVVGLGYFSQFHLAAWQKIAETELVAVTDLDPNRRASAAADGIPVVESLDAVLAADPDILDIVAPPRAHAAIIKASLKPGRVVICQKPFCTSLQEAKEIIALAQAAQTRLVIHENFRFQPWYRVMKAFLDTGRMGQIWSARFDLRPGDGRGKDAYRERQPAFRSMPRLLIHETGVHFIDLFRWMLGDVTTIYADLRKLNPVLKGEDAGLVIMEHASGALSVFDGNRLSDHLSDTPRRTMGEMRIEGEGGCLSLNGQGEVWFRPFGSETTEQLRVVQGEGFGGGCVAALCQHVADAASGHSPLENAAQDYLPIIALTELAYQSAAEGRRLPFDMKET